MDLTTQFFLLTIDPEKGTNRINTLARKYGVAGAMLLEWTLAEQMKSEESGKMRYVGSPTGAGGLRDEIAVWASELNKPLKPKNWVRKLGNKWSNKMIHDLHKRLVQQGVLQRQKKKFLGLIPYSVYPVIERSERDRLVQTVRSVVLTGETPDEETASLIGLLVATDGFKIPFDKDERKDAKKRMKEIAKGEQMPQAVNKAIQEVQAAVTAGVAAAVATSSASGGGS